ncbi:general substrate transporter [Phyllosticta citriasiana]|uniref:general substrate transporter n=1 Tax=Phyllosticta citriasiana TaxID=595635 RepID=UPI0030FD782C
MEPDRVLSDKEIRVPDFVGEDVSYGPGGFHGLIGSPFVCGAAFFASLGGFSFGYDQGVISVIDVMPQFKAKYPEIESGFYKGLMTAMLELGAFLGCFFMPWLADKISRKWALSIVVVIFCIGAIIQTAAPTYAVLTFGCFFGGIGVGTLALGAPLYISEIAPPNLRGTLFVLESVSIVLGVVIAYWMTYGTHPRYLAGEASFRLPFGLQMVCAVFLGVGIHFFPYSPRWLGLVGREEDCIESLCKLRRLPRTDHPIMVEVEFQARMLEKRHPGARGFKLELLTWTDLFKKRTWRRTAVGMGVAFFQQFSGINGRKLLTMTALSTTLPPCSPASLVAVIICFCIIDKVGRRPLAVWGGVGMTLPYIVMSALVGLYSDDWAANKAAGWATTAMAYFYILLYGVSYSPLGWALPSEVFNNSTRAKGVALSTATVWISNFIIGVIVPTMIEEAGFGTYVFFAIMCMLAAVWAFLLVPETKGKTLEQIDEVFGDASGAEEREVMREVALSGGVRRAKDMLTAGKVVDLRDETTV